MFNQEKKPIICIRTFSLTLTIINIFWVKIVIKKTLLCHLFILSFWTTVIIIRVNRDTTARCKFTPNFQVTRVQKLHQIFTNGINTVFMEVSVITVTKEIKL